VIGSRSSDTTEARDTLRTRDGALIYVRNRGVRSGPPEGLARLARGEAVDPASYYFRTVPPSSRGRRPTRGSPHEDFLSRVFLPIRCTRPATARTLRGAASQMVTAESRLQAMAIQNTSR